MSGTGGTLGAAIKQGLDHAALAYQLPFWLLVVGHTASILPLFKGYTPYWLVSWLVVFLAGYGGGTLSALLLQSPTAAAIGIFSRNELGICFTLTWWAYNYFPGGWVARVVDLPPVYAATKVARAILRANTVVQRVNAAAKLYPGVMAGPLLLGTLGGCGGTLLTDAFSHCAGYSQGPNQLSHPGHSLRSAFLAAALQYLLVHVAGLLTAQQGLGLIISLYVAHSLATDITGQPCDYTAPLARLFHKITLIPEPGLDAMPATPAPKGGKAAPPAQRRSIAAAALVRGAASGDEREPAAAPASEPARRTTRRRAAAATN